MKKLKEINSKDAESMQEPAAVNPQVMAPLIRGKYLEAIHTMLLNCKFNHELQELALFESVSRFDQFINNQGISSGSKNDLLLSAVASLCSVIPDGKGKQAILQQFEPQAVLAR